MAHRMDIEARQTAERESLLPPSQLTQSTDLSKDNRTLATCVVLFFVFVLGGAAVFSGIEQWDYLTSVYFCVVMLTTVGYGDVSPATDLGKFFSCVLGVFGIALIGSAIGIVATAMADAFESFSDDTEETSGTTALSVLPQSSQSKPRASRAEKIIQSRRISLLLSLLYFVLMITASALLFSTVESDDKMTLGFGDAMYMSVMTATTIGFGDVSPKSTAGRAVAIFWILISTFVTANVLSNISAVFIEDRALRLEEKMLSARMTRQDLREWDANADGAVDELEYLVGMLVRTGRVDADLITDIRAQFRRRDRDKSSRITVADLLNSSASPARTLTRASTSSPAHLGSTTSPARTKGRC